MQKPVSGLGDFGDNMYAAQQVRMSCCGDAMGQECTSFCDVAWFWLGLAVVVLMPKKGR